MKSIQFRIRVFLVMLLAVVIIGTFGFTVIEKLSPADAFYFTIITIATVGYGDIYPLTQMVLQTLSYSHLFPLFRQVHKVRGIYVWMVMMSTTLTD